MLMKTAKPVIKFRPALFWDVNPKKIDVKKNAQYIIERIADFGNDKEARWMWEYYDKRILRKVISNSRCVSSRTRVFWTLLLKD